MTGPTVTILPFSFTILPVPTVVALLGTAAIAYFLGRRMKQLPAILIASLAVPLALVLLALYLLSTEGPNGPPPGMMFLGVLIAAAATVPVTLVVSGLAVRLARR